jgi:TRAP-type C4-dicarboxylate transport system permease small subunit
VLSGIDRTYTWVLRLMMGLAAVYLGLMMVSIVYATTFRTLGLSYTPYSFVFIEYGFIYCLMFGSPWIVRQRGHVFIEILTAAVSAEVRNWLSRLVALICVLICAVFAFYSGLLALEDIRVDEIDVRGSMDIPRWIVTVTMPLGFGLMAVEFLRFVVGREIIHSGQAGVHE